jgi:hypothetical protein
MIRLSLIDHGPQRPAYPTAPSFPATAFSKMTTWLRGTNIFPNHSPHSAADTRGGSIYIGFSRKAFENVLDKVQYRFVHDDCSPPRNIFLNVTCYANDIPVPARNKSLVLTSLLVIGFLVFLAACRWYLVCGLVRAVMQAQSVLPLPPASKPGPKFPVRSTMALRSWDSCPNVVSSYCQLQTQILSLLIAVDAPPVPICRCSSSP